MKALRDEAGKLICFLPDMTEPVTFAAQPPDWAKQSDDPLADLAAAEAALGRLGPPPRPIIMPRGFADEHAPRCSGSARRWWSASRSCSSNASRRKTPIGLLRGLEYGLVRLLLLAHPAPHRRRLLRREQARPVIPSAPDGPT
jgi:hypothetical protein